MYLDHFGLNQPPFKITPNTGFFFAGGNRGAILDALLYAIIHGEGLVKVTGEIGSGKTMLCRMLESMLPENVEAIYLANPSLSRDEVFHAIGTELNLATEGKRAGEILRLIQDDLIEKHASGKQVVLLVEEAQAMPLDTLEEIRLLSNLETAHHKLLQIVLFGQPELDENLSLPRMRQFRERITHGFKVPPLDQKDIPEYLMFRMRAAGYRGPDIFSAGAIKLIISASKGITRRINIVADKALLAAFSENTHNILPKHVQAAVNDSEFAPPLGRLPLKNIGFAVLLLGIGMSLGAGWQHFVSWPGKPEQAAPASVVAAAQSPRQVKIPESLSAPIPASGQSILQQRLDATQAWLASGEGSRYTIQLMLTDSDSPAQMEKTLSKLSGEIELAKIYVYSASITAKRQFGITFGDFSSREQALAALDRLPSGYRVNRPVLRTVKGILNEAAKQQEH